jgi:putative ABC transport system permease protein
MTGLVQDLRFALRTVRTTPGFLAAILMLAIAIGGTSATFSVVDAVLLRPLAFPDADRLVRITADYTRSGSTDVGVSGLEMADYRDAGIFQAVSAIDSINANLTGAHAPERLEGVFVSGSYFSILGVLPARGRVFAPSDEVPGIGDVAVVSHGLWQRQLGGREEAIGSVIRLDDEPVVVVGVLPPDFRHPARGIEGEPDFFLPAGFSGPPLQPSRAVKRLEGVIARLPDDVTIEDAARRLDALGATLRSQHPDAYPSEVGWRPRLVPLARDVAGSVRPSILTLAAAVASVLLIACANVANLLLARGAGRRREVGVRAALGATRGRLVRLLLTESLLLSSIGGVAGLLVAQWLIAAATSLMPADLPVSSTPTLDLRAFAFAGAVSLLTGALFGAWPALALSRAHPRAVGHGTERSQIATAGGRRLRRLLVVAEVAVALVLLIGAGLLLRSFAHVWLTDPGFSADRILAARIWMPLPNDPSRGRYAEHATRVRFYRTLLDQLQRTPGVEAAGVVSRLPLASRAAAQAFLIEGRPLESALQNSVEPAYASPGYFTTMGTRLRRGRLFTDEDTSDRPPVLIVSESFARRYFPDRDPIGVRIRPGGLESTAAWFTIVGVVEDIRTVSLDRPPDAQSYRCAWQRSDLAMGLVVRASGDPRSVEPALRAAIADLDPDLPVFGVRPMPDLIAANLASRRFAVATVGAFAGLALLLAVVGLHSVLSYLVRQRTSEIGLRMALGATPRRVLTLVLGEGLGLAAAGIVLGLAGGAIAARAISRLLVGVGPIDPWTFGAQAALLALAAAVACWIPARRALRVDPLVALRQE